MIEGVQHGGLAKKTGRSEGAAPGQGRFVRAISAASSPALTLTQKARAVLRSLLGRPDHPVVAKLREIDAVLVAKGWPPISDWWWQVIEDAYDSGCREFYIRGGRRGGKSTTMCRIAVAECLAGGHVIAPGDTGFFAIISAEKDQAKERHKTCGEILKSLGIAHHYTAEQVVITDAVAYTHRDQEDGKQYGQVGIRVFTASLTGIVGFTAIGALCDEQARWRDRESGANPAKQVVGTLKPSLLTNRAAKQWNVSAPWSTLDLHYEGCDRGNTKSQRVYLGTSWEMNPTVTEQDTHDLEADQQTWEREYKAVPMPSDETKFFSAAAITAAAKVAYVETKRERTVAGGDFAFRRDATAWVCMSKHEASKATSVRYRVVDDQERVPLAGLPLVPSSTIGEALASATTHSADSMCCDLHYIETVREELEGSDVELVEFPTAPDDIAKAYVNARVLLAKGWLDLSRASPRLIDQLKNTTATPTEGAGLSIKNKRTLGHHGDSVSAFVCAVYATTREAPGKRISGGPRRFTTDRGFDTQADSRTWHDNAEDWK